MQEFEQTIFSPSAYANRLGQAHASEVSADFKKEQGQFLTPIEIAKFMAGLSTVKKEYVSVLDAGAGAGVLTCALVERIIIDNLGISEICITAYELDEKIALKLEKSFENLKKWGAKHAVVITTMIEKRDFVLTNAPVLNQFGDLFSDNQDLKTFDIIISNPPYFKIPKDDPRAKATESLNKGQPNIYALFLGLASYLLNDGGEMIFITPRSFMSGPYFQRFREVLFSKVNIDQIHIFRSRSKAFKKDKVLQENIILKASRNSGNPTVKISTSAGIDDLHAAEARTHRTNKVFDYSTNTKIFYLPTSPEEEEILELFHSWSDRLPELGFGISTGPVVPFRCKEFLHYKKNREGESVPLYWLPNVSGMGIQHPVMKKGKEQFIEVSSASLSLLVQNSNYVLLRRFSAKGDQKRLIAAPYYAKHNTSKFIGLENHLNYIYRLVGSMTEVEMLGIAGLLNSTIFDMYFRTFNGNTQVSATEIRNMPVPALDIIKKIGEILMSEKTLSQTVIDHVVHFAISYNVIVDQELRPSEVTSYA